MKGFWEKAEKMTEYASLATVVAVIGSFVFAFIGRVRIAFDIGVVSLIASFLACGIFSFVKGRNGIAGRRLETQYGQKEGFAAIFYSIILLIFSVICMLAFIQVVSHPPSWLLA